MDTESRCGSAQLPKRYDPHRFEAARYARWETTGTFRAGRRPDAEPWAMILPPPNVTGTLHAGHAFEHTISDAFTRYRRMAGYDTAWLPGLDHAGIATQNIVEAQLAAEGLTRHDLGRDAFVERTWAWKRRSGGQILNQMRRLGASCDWDRLTFTLDPGPQAAVRAAFWRLYDDGLIYTATRTIGWCDRCSTALAEIEIGTGDDAEICSRCGSAIDRRPSDQWFLRTTPLAAAARAAVDSGELTIEPATARDEWMRWLERLDDWCISRQLWWGHQLPIWYAPEGTPASFPPDVEIPDGYTPSTDTLDTWFSSALWPLATLGWPTPGEDFDRYYPNTLLCTGSDLLFFWAIRMTLLCCYLTGRAPFRTLWLHGMVRDSRGAKMSKSKGNTIDPLEYLDAHGADPLRFALARHARAGADAPFGEDDLAGAAALCKKLWSITRFATTHRAPAPATWPPGDDAPLLAAWLRACTARLRDRITDAYERHDLATATDELARFIDTDLSELYIEAARPTLTRGGDAADALIDALCAALQTLYRLAHPIIPFLTEELHAHLTGDDPVLDDTGWPAPDPDGAEPDATQTVEELRAAAAAARAHRSALGLPAGEPLPAAAAGTPLRHELEALGRLALREHLEGITLRFGRLELTLPAGTSLDADTRARLRRRCDELTATCARLDAKLTDPEFTKRAPGEIVERTAAALSAATGQLAAQRALLDGT